MIQCLVSLIMKKVYLREQSIAAEEAEAARILLECTEGTIDPSKVERATDNAELEMFKWLNRLLKDLMKMIN